MNGRIKLEDSPWGRLAAVVESINRQFTNEREKNGAGPAAPDYADYSEKMKPFIERELLLRTISEVRKLTREAIDGRMRELDAELRELNKRLPDEYKL